MTDHPITWEFSIQKALFDGHEKIFLHSVYPATCVYLALKLINGNCCYSLYHNMYNQTHQTLDIQMEALDKTRTEGVPFQSPSQACLPHLYKQLCKYQDLPAHFTVKLSTGASVGIEHLTNCFSFNKILYDSMHNSDIVIKVQGVSFAAHKWVLSLQSEVFKKMFETDMVEAQTGVIEINDVTSEVFKVFLQCLYTSECDKAVFTDNFSELLKMFCMYMLNDLVTCCTASLEKRLTIYNAVDVMLILDAHDYKSAKEVAMDFVAKNIMEIMANTDILMRSPDLLLEISKQAVLKKA